jgi:hypothetical protein
MMRSSGSTGPAAGYSGTPLVRKLGIKEGHLLAMVHAPAGWEVPEPPPGVHVVARRQRADVVVAFFRHRRDLEREIPALARAIRPAGSLWVAWPRRAGGHASDITDNVVRDIALPLGIVDVKIAALDNDWSGVKLVWRLSLR